MYGTHTTASLRVTRGNASDLRPAGLEQHRVSYVHGHATRSALNRQSTNRVQTHQARVGSVARGGLLVQTWLTTTPGDVATTMPHATGPHAHGPLWHVACGRPTLRRPTALQVLPNTRHIFKGTPLPLSFTLPVACSSNTCAALANSNSLILSYTCTHVRTLSCGTAHQSRQDRSVWLCHHRSALHFTWHSVS